MFQNARQLLASIVTCRPVADNKQYVASLHAGHKKGVISVRDRTQFPTSRTIQQQLTSGTDQSEGSGDEPKKQGWFSRLFRG